MKKKLLVLFMFVVMTSMVTAGTIEDLQYDDRSQYFIWEYEQTRTINDDNVFINADQLQGHSVNELLPDGNGVSTSRVVNMINNAVIETKKYCDANDRDLMFKIAILEEYARITNSQAYDRARQNVLLGDEFIDFR